MTASRCSRSWQVEASRDGRLTGKDLTSAVRHRENCADCADEERALTGIAQRLAALPELDRNALSARRTRQNLMSALNERVLAAPRRRYRSLMTAFAACLALSSAVLGSWLVARARRTVPLATPQLIDVYAAPGARWSAHTEALLASVNFDDGAASFVVHPHQGRRVVVRLPDGEVEDMGTVFEVRVGDRQTRRVAVSEGKVVVRLKGRPEFSLAAGEAWEPTPPAPPSAASISAPASSVAAHVAPPSATAAPARRAAAPAPATQSSAPSGPTASSSANAEDDAYLHIVSLLRSDRTAEARSQAKSYLLRFPNGFRRIEVLNIAMQSSAEVSDASPSK